MGLYDTRVVRSRADPAAYVQALAEESAAPLAYINSA